MHTEDSVFVRVHCTCCYYKWSLIMSHLIPDILVPYNPSNITEKCKIVPLYVRPETNNVGYESVIMKILREVGQTVFMANYNGELIKKRHIILNHYFSQHLFALHGRHELEKYPEFIKIFEKKFGIKADKVNIMGAYEFLNSAYGKGYNEDSLFSYYVDEKDYINFLGHSMKKIDDIYVINYDIPGIFKRYSNNSNILVVAIQVDNQTPFSMINKRIYEIFTRQENVTLFEVHNAPQLKWYERVKRTYHIAHNNIESMLDMTDYIVSEDGTPIGYYDTPLGKTLVNDGVFAKDELDLILNFFKKFPLTYIIRDGKKRLINLRQAGSYIKDGRINELSPASCAKIFSKVISCPG